MAFVLIHLARLYVTVLKALLDLVVKQTSMNVNHIRVRMREAV